MRPPPPMFAGLNLGGSTIPFGALIGLPDCAFNGSEAIATDPAAPVSNSRSLLRDTIPCCRSSIKLAMACPFPASRSSRAYSLFASHLLLHVHATQVEMAQLRAQAG